MSPKHGIGKRAPIAAGLGAIPDTAEEEAKRQKRMARFQEVEQPAAPGTIKAVLPDNKEPEQASASSGRVRGSSQALEKPYFRLTAAPDLATVRPPPVLKLALRHVQQHWIQHADYKYACEQLKSIRQDLTVQHIQNGLAVRVYETHARMAIEQGDLAEFKQCLAVLRPLHSQGVKGDAEEFVMYGLLHAAAASPKQLAVDMRDVPGDLWQHPFLQHALQVCKAVCHQDARGLVGLYTDAPRMAPYLMDHMLERLRKHCAVVMHAYTGPIPLSAAATFLCFDTRKEVAKFWRSCDGEVDKKGKMLHPKRLGRGEQAKASQSVASI